MNTRKPSKRVLIQRGGSQVPLGISELARHRAPHDGIHDDKKSRQQPAAYEVSMMVPWHALSGTGFLILGLVRRAQLILLVHSDSGLASTAAGGGAAWFTVLPSIVMRCCWLAAGPLPGAARGRARRAARGGHTR